MARIKQSDTISDLHYALTQLQCNKCGSTLKWTTNFSDINQPRYLSSHCNQDFIMSIASVRVKAQESDKAKPRALESTPALTNEHRLRKEKQEKHRTRELVLPSDSNVVKGNV
jgi:transposase-like protein